MVAVPKLSMPGSLVALALLVLAVPVGIVVSGAATAGGEAKATPGAPVVDPYYLYGQLYTMASSFSYRISGADGDPMYPADPFNLPPTVNGWQELVAYWKNALTNPEADKKNRTPLAAFATSADHYFRRTGGYQFDSNDAEVTLPGGSCPGERVLLASHPDERPVPTDVVGLINSGSTSGVTGFGAARRHITDSNLGNEGAYDGLSGVAVTLGEYKALLDWYDANGTYPERTLKVALLDASRGRTDTGLFGREGSAFYAANLIPAGPQGKVVLFANMDALGLDYPAYHLGTEYFWNNVNGGGVPPWSTFIKATPTAPNQAYPDTGAGSPGANIAANTGAISLLHDDLEAAVTAGFEQQGAKYDFSVPVENPLRYNKTGQAPNPAVPTPLKPAYSAADQALFSPVRDDTDALEDEQAFFDLGIPGFTVSGVKSSSIDENPYAAAVSASVKATPILQYAGNQSTFQIGNSTPQAGMTTTAAAVAAGDTNVKVASVTSLTAGQAIFIDTGQNIEFRQIQAVGTSSAGGTGVTLTEPLQLAHASGVRFHVNEGQPQGFTGDTIEHLNYFASGAPHGVEGPGQPTEELLRALELPAQWTSLLLAGDDYLGATAKPKAPVAYFETDPVKPAATLTVTFDAGFSRDKNGETKGLEYYWEFGDGTHAVGATVSHTYASPVYADVELAVRKGRDWGLYRQALPVDNPAGPAPATSPCGTFTPDESAALITAAKTTLDGKKVKP